MTRFGIDAQRLAGQRLGVGRYIEYLLKNWDTQLASDERVVAFVRDPFDPSAFGLSDRIEVVTLPSRLKGHLWQNIVLPSRTRGVDVLFGPSYSVPLTYRGRSVVAIHSANELEAGAHQWWYQATYAQIYRASARRARAVIVPSESTKIDLQAAYGTPSAKIVVVPQGADEAFRPLDDPQLAKETRERFFGSDVPFVVFVGKLSQRRNIGNLLKAFAIARRRADLPHRLLLLGPNHVDLPLAQYIAELDLDGLVIQTDGRFASHLDLVSVYNAADAYVNASRYEGFSMTMVEALSCGTPIVASSRGALREIAGDAAILVDDPEPEALADGLVRLLTNPALAGDLRRRGTARAERFRWGPTAQQTLDVLRRVART